MRRVSLSEGPIGFFSLQVHPGSGGFLLVWNLAALGRQFGTETASAAAEQQSASFKAAWRVSPLTSLTGVWQNTTSEISQVNLA